MNNTNYHNQLHEYIDGELSMTEQKAFEQHLTQCNACRTELQKFKTLQNRISELPDSIQPRHDLWKNIESTLFTHPLPLVSGLEKRKNGSHTEPLKNLSVQQPMMWYLRAAAVVGIVIVSGLAWYLLHDSTAQEKVAEKNANRPVQQENTSEQKETLVDDHQTVQPAEEQATTSLPSEKIQKKRLGTSDTETERLLKRIAQGTKLSPMPLALSKYGKIVGRVSNGKNQPIAGAIIRIVEMKREIISDENGEFQISDISSGVFTLLAYGGGYQQQKTIQVRIIPGFTALLNFQLDTGDVTLRDLVANDDARAKKYATTLPPGSTQQNLTASSSLKSVEDLFKNHSQTGKVSGKVTDEKHQPIAGVTILVVGLHRGAATELDGKFTIVGIPYGTYTLRASAVGYTVKEITNVTIASGTVMVDFVLHADAVALNEVTVTTDAQLVNSMATSSTQTTTVTAAPNAKAVQDVIALQAAVVENGSSASRADGRANGYTADYGRLHAPASQPNAEQYDNIEENNFLDVVKTPLSTFSIDVDNASYSNVRRFINDGQFPPKDAVRIEEMVNYFSYEYPQPKEGDPFSITTELASCPWNSVNKLLLVGLQGKKIAAEHLPASNLTFLIDVSGSMNEPNKLPLVKSAFKLLVGQLREQDRVSIVVYAGRAGLVLPPTQGDRKGEILSAIDRLEAGGSTAGGAGIQLAYDIAKENFMKEGNNRVILATDGDFNVGVSSDEGLVRLIEERRDRGIYLSVLGFGMGNYKDSKMEKLADKGNGNYAYIDNLQEARKVFVNQMAGTLLTIAKDVKIQIEFNPANVKSYRLIGYENRMLAKEDFNDDRKDAGELGAGHTVTALYEIVPSQEEKVQRTIDPLKYQSDHSDGNVREGRYSNEILTVKLRYKPPQENDSKLIVNVLRGQGTDLDATSENFRFAASVAEFGMLLRESKYKGGSGFDQVILLAKESKGPDTEGYRAEFIRLVETAKLLSR